MVTFKKNKKFILLLLIMSAFTAATISAESRYAEIKHGVGNVLIGEVLPYDNDSGYRNVVQDSVTLSQLRRWDTFFYRAYFSKKISEIDHDVRVLVMDFKGVGGRNAQFEREVGGIVITWTFREEDPDSYGNRTEWARYFPDFSWEGAKFTYFMKPYDSSKPETFEFGCGEDDIAGKMELTPDNLENWKNTYRLKEIDVTMQVFSFTDGGSEMSAETRTVIEADKRLDGGYDFHEDEEISRILSVRLWENRQLLAKGHFRIILD